MTASSPTASPPVGESGAIGSCMFTSLKFALPLLGRRVCNRRFNAAALVASCALFAALPAAAIPTVFPVQGFLTDDEGEPLEGEFSSQLTLYTDATGNDAVYSVGATLDIEEGSFYYYIGSDLELESAVIEGNDALFLEISLNGETLEPRLEIGSVPYSTLAGRCEVADSILVNDTEVTGAGLQRRIAIPCGVNQAIRSVALDGIPVCVDIATDGDGGGDITEVVASIGLNGGGAAGSVSLSVDYTETQRRISNACPADQFVVSVSEAGSLSCALPAEGNIGDITAVTAGEGLSGGGTEQDVALAIDFATTQRRVSNACPTDTFAVSIGVDGTLACLAAPAGNTGDIEQVVAGGGLAGGGDAGSVTLSIAEVTCPAGNFQTGFDATGAPTCELESGDIGEVTAGEGLSGGGVSGTVALAIDEDVVQRRVQSCVTGQLITAIAVDGTVTCVDFPAVAESKFQTKALATSVTADGAVAAISFSNLVVGRRYRLSGQVALNSTAIAGTDVVNVTAANNGATVAAFATTLPFGEQRVLPALATTFVAGDTSVDVTVTGLSATVALVGGIDQAGTFVTIEEVANAVTTTDF